MSGPATAPSEPEADVWGVREALQRGREAAAAVPAEPAVGLLHELDPGGGVDAGAMPAVPVPDARDDAVGVQPAVPDVDVGGVAGFATYYGASYNGQPLGCGTGLYSSDNDSIAASAWNPATGHTYGCGTRLRLTGPGGSHIVTVQDACPGCAPNVIDLSESANRRVCATAAIPYEHTCQVMIEVVQ